MEQNQLQQRLDNIERLIISANKPFWGVSDMQVMTGLARKTIYNLVNRRIIPAYKPNGKELYFDPAEIKKYILSNKIRTDAEIAEMSKNR